MSHIQNTTSLSGQMTCTDNPELSSPERRKAQQQQEHDSPINSLVQQRFDNDQDRGFLADHSYPKQQQVQRCLDGEGSTAPSVAEADPQNSRRKIGPPAPPHCFDYLANFEILRKCV